MYVNKIWFEQGVEETHSIAFHYAVNSKYKTQTITKHNQ
jgi:hypothetical protein